VGQQGVTGGGVTGTVETSKVSVSGGVSYDSPTKSVGFTLSVSGGKTQQPVDCLRKGRPRLVFNCELVKHVPAVPEVKEESVQDKAVRYVFFDYCTPKVRTNFRLPSDIQELHNAGYRVTSVEGFTSPEGPREAGPNAPLPGSAIDQRCKNFTDNVTLAKERAQSALSWLKSIACPSCDLTGVTATGRSELPHDVGQAIPEPKGRSMERTAVKEFLGKIPGSTPDPLAPQDPAALAAFQRLPERQQREKAFELMRRAEIRLEHKRITQPYQAGKPAKDETQKVACGQDVIDAARTSFGISIATGPAAAKPQ